MAKNHKEPNKEQGKEVLEKRGHVPQKGQTVKPQDYKNSADGPAPGAKPADTSSKDPSDS